MESNLLSDVNLTLKEESSVLTEQNGHRQFVTDKDAPNFEIQKFRTESLSSYSRENHMDLAASNERLQRDLERYKVRVEQQEVKWEHDMYELRRKYEESEQECHRLHDELMELKKSNAASVDALEVVGGFEEETILMRLRLENRQLEEKLEEYICILIVDSV